MTKQQFKVDATRITTPAVTAVLPTFDVNSDASDPAKIKLLNMVDSIARPKPNNDMPRIYLHIQKRILYISLTQVRNVTKFKI